VIRLFWVSIVVILLSGHGLAMAADSCIAPGTPPTMRVDIDATQPQVDHLHSRTQLHQFQIDTVSPYGPEAKVHVNGLMRGAIKVETGMNIAWQRLSTGDENCYWFNDVHVTLLLSPTIYIAAEIPEPTCMYHSVLQHEYKHYAVDISVAKDYQILLQEELSRFLQQTGPIGPFPKEVGDAPKQELVKRLDAVMQSVNNRMKYDRMKRQSTVDTREEYERVVRACPGDMSLVQ
jgi:hypothetical protein